MGNPVIAGFFPDPTVCAAEDGYYLACSSFEYFPGVPLFHSTDLTTWRQIGNALDRPSQLTPGGAADNQGVYAPTLRHHDGRFWLVTTNVSEAARGHLLVTAEDPAGPWSDPLHITGSSGIDPDIAWDADGSCYLTWSDAGIRQARIDPVAGRLLEEPRPLWSGTGLAYPEAPHLHHHDGWWYLVIAEGGTERGHCVAAARSRSITGPFTGAPGNPLLTRRGTTHSVQNTGHADLVRTPDGDWAAVYLGVRPRGTTPKFHVNGREVFLAGVDWAAGWPAFDTERHAVPAADHSFTDAFEGESLDPMWVSPNSAPDRIAKPCPGGLSVDPAPARDREPGILAVRARDLAWTASARVRSGGGRARLLVRVDDTHWCGVEVGDGLAVALAEIGPLSTTLATLPVRPSDTVDLVVRARPAPAHRGPDELWLGVRTSVGEHEMAVLDGRYLSTEVAGGFTGRVIGVQARQAPFVLERFTYSTEG